MLAALKFSNIIKWLRLFTYICATVLLITGNDSDHLKYLIPLTLLVFLADYSRDYWLTPDKKPLWLIWASIAAEMLLIIVMGFFDTENISILLYYVCLASTIITHGFLYSIPVVAVYIVSGFVMEAARNGFDSIMQMMLSYIVSTVFVMVMSYLVKMQLREKEKLAHLNTELEQAYGKLIENSAVSQKLAIEQERTRMARELHDTLAHTLTSLIVQLEVCRKLAPIDPEKLTDELEKAQELSRSGFSDIKRSIRALRPQAMEDKPFIDSILSVIQSTMESTKVHIAFNNFLPHPARFSSAIEVALFRVVQESLTNSIRHGQATEIEITMKQEDNHLKMSLADNGKGCSAIKKGYGTLGIKERIGGLNGSVEFESSPGKGFKTQVSLPLEVTA